ncbi:MAG: NADPH-dependent 7-cyano-7-deazaguanine reductase [candidate division BRC1 bacterium ADurb.BinA364]|nr:MAG: NADPH-dependent 7-cyano-7-deazaguanine reductase [candidate division BRC1 bacterium ADurb.BinA364]
MEIQSDTTGVSGLGSGPGGPSKRLEAFPNSHPDRDTLVTFHCEEFSCHCPVTGQPDYARLEIAYIPDKKVLESKSLKLYLWTYRDIGVFHEHVVNRILDDLTEFLEPRWMRVVGRFNVRGGISIDVTAETPRRRGAQDPQFGQLRSERF